MEKLLLINVTKRKQGWPYLYQEEIDFKSKSIIREKEGHNIMIKRPIQQEDKIIKYVYAPNNRVPKYIKQMLTEQKGK